MSNLRELNFIFLEKHFRRSTYMWLEVIGVLLLLLGAYKYITQETNLIADHWAVIIPIGLGLSFVLFASIYLFGNTFARVNDKQIVYKPYIYRKEQVEFWDNVVLVRTRLQSVEFFTKKNKVLRIDLSKKRDDIAEELEAFVYAMATEKSIPIDRYLGEEADEQNEVGYNLFYAPRLKNQSYSIFTVVFGLILVFVATDMLILKEGKTAFDILLVVLMFGYCAFAIAQAVILERGKAYVAIDTDRIAIKPSVFKKEERVDWHMVKDLSIQSNQLHLLLNDNSSKIIDLSMISYSPHQEVDIKNQIIAFARERIKLKG